MPPPRTPPSGTLLLPLLLAIAAVYGFGRWLLGASMGGPKEAPVRLARPAVGEGFESIGEPIGPVELSPYARAQPAAAFDVDTANWVAGRLVLPEGVPDDPTLAVVATRAPFPTARGPVPPGGFAPRVRAPVGATPGSGEEGAEEGDVRVPVGEDGAFFLAFPSSWPLADLRVDGRYLFLERPVALRPAGKETRVVLRPEVGAWVRGRVRREPGEAEGAEPPDRTRVTIWLRPLFGDDALTTEGFELGDAIERARRAPVDANGNFELRGLPPHPRWSLVATCPGRLAGEPVALAPRAGGELVAEPELLGGATVSGRVLGPDGEPLAGAEVVLRAQELERTSPVPVEDLVATCDAAGAFRVGGLAGGDWLVLPRRSGSWAPETPRLSLGGRETRGGLLLRLVPGQRIAGQVVWSDGTPAADARVELVPLALEAPAGPGPPGSAGADDRPAPASSPYVQPPAPMRSDAEGRYAFEGVAPGRWTVAAGGLRAAAPGQLERGVAKPQVAAAGAQEVVLLLEPLLPLAGVVRTEPGGPLRSFELIATPAGDGTAEPFAARVESADGSFRARAFEPGSWHVTILADGTVRPEPLVVRLPREADAPPLEFVLSPAAEVAGSVVGPDGEPVAGAEVRALAGDAARGYRAWSTAQARGFADALGRYALPGLTPGDFQLVASARGLAPSAPLALTLFPGLRRTGAQLALRAGGAIEGELLGSGDVGVAGRWVHAALLDPPELVTTRTDADGRFAFDHLAEGSWHVWSFVAGGEAYVDPLTTAPDGPDGAPPLELDEGLVSAAAAVRDGRTTRITLGSGPERPVELSGAVRAAAMPIEAALYFFRDGAGPLEGFATARSGEDGAYAVRLEAPGRYLVALQWSDDGAPEALSRESVVLDVPAEAEHVHDFELPAGSVAGRVIDATGRPVAGARVELVPVGPPRASAAPAGFARTTTGADGAFAFSHLADGTYAVVAEAPETGPHAGLGRTSLGDLRVEGGARTAGVDVCLHPGREVSGTALDADGRPVAGATVFVLDASGRPLGRFSQIRSGPDGAFRCGPLAPGSYAIVARTGEYATRVPRRVEIDDPEPGEDGADEAVELRLELVPGAFLHVSVEDEAGEPLEARVEVTDGAGLRQVGFEDYSRLSAPFERGFRSGALRVGPLAPGRYTVQATTDAGARATEEVELAGEDRALVLRPAAAAPYRTRTGDAEPGEPEGKGPGH